VIIFKNYQKKDFNISTVTVGRNDTLNEFFGIYKKSEDKNIFKEGHNCLLKKEFCNFIRTIDNCKTQVHYTHLTVSFINGKNNGNYLICLSGIFYLIITRINF
jgi:hypothetical protein